MFELTMSVFRVSTQSTLLLISSAGPSRERRRDENMKGLLQFDVDVREVFGGHISTCNAFLGAQPANGSLRNCTTDASQNWFFCFDLIQDCNNNPQYTHKVFESLLFRTHPECWYWIMSVMWLQSTFQLRKPLMLYSTLRFHLLIGTDTIFFHLPSCTAKFQPISAKCWWRENN